MSYQIDLTYRELDGCAYVSIFALTTFYTSALKSQFQRIGWLFSIFDSVECKLEMFGLRLENPEYAIEALKKYSELSEEDCEQLLTLKSVGDRFSFVWSRIDEDERKYALMMPFDGYNNFWPGFGAYQLGALQGAKPLLPYTHHPAAHYDELTKVPPI